MTEPQVEGATGGVESHQSDQGDFVREFTPEAEELYDCILKADYKKAIEEIFAETWHDRDCGELASELLDGKYDETSDLKKLLYNTSTAEEVEELEEKTRKLLGNFHKDKKKTEAATVHLFISAPLNPTEREHRKEEFVVYANRRRTVTAAPGKEGSNALLFEIERQGTPETAIPLFVERASKVPGVNKVKIVVSGHGTLEGKVMLSGGPDGNEFTDPKDIISALEAPMKDSPLVKWPKVTLIFAHCYGFRAAETGATPLPFKVRFLTSKEIPLTKSIRAFSHHVNLNSDARTSLPPRVFTLSDDELEAEKKLDPPSVMEGGNTAEADNINQLASGIQQMEITDDIHTFHALISAPQDDNHRSRLNKQLQAFAQENPLILDHRNVTFFEMTQKESARLIISRCFEEIQRHHASIKWLFLVIAGEGGKRGTLSLKQPQLGINNDEIIQSVCHAMNRDGGPSVVLVFAHDYSHLYDRLAAKGAKDKLKSKGKHFKLRWFTEERSPHVPIHPQTCENWHLQKYAPTLQDWK